MKYKAVLFDLGGTLVKTLDVPEIFRRILETYGFRVDADEIRKAHETNQKEMDAEAGQVKLGMAFWTKWNATILRKIGIENEADLLGQKISGVWWDHADLQLFPDVLPTISHLEAEKVKTGIVTNALRSECEQILQRLQVGSYFDLTVGNDDCQAAKPKAKIFLFALEKLRARASETLFVGDDLRRDYEGSKKAGLKPLLINRREKPLKGIDSINSLAEILRYL